MSYTIVSNRDQLKSELVALEIFDLIGGLRTDQENTCHDKSAQVLSELIEHNYFGRYVGVMWGDQRDHVCLEVGREDLSELYCVDVTIGQFKELERVVPSPLHGGMVFIGSRKHWHWMLRDMFGRKFDIRAEFECDWGMVAKAAIQGPLWDAGKELLNKLPQDGDGFDFDFDHAHQNFNGHINRTGPCIIC